MDTSLVGTKVVLLCGPPRCGKDMAAKHLGKALGAARIGFADHLKVATHAAYGLFGFRGAPCPALAFEAVKDEPLPEFMGLTPRQAYIRHSEDYMKPLHGPDVFGHLFLRALRASGAPLVAVPDSGFAAEAKPVLDAVGRDNALLVRVHRPGHDFSNDSRAYISLPVVETLDLDNAADGDPAPFLAALEAATRRWLGR